MTFGNVDCLFCKVWDEAAKQGWVALGAASLLPFFLQMAWYTFIFGKLWGKWATADKGVKKFDQWTFRYPFWAGMVGSTLVCITRAILVAGLAGLLKHNDNLCHYLEVATLVFTCELLMGAGYFWNQRPYQLFLIDFSGILATSLLTGAVLFYL